MGMKHNPYGLRWVVEARRRAAEVGVAAESLHDAAPDLYAALDNLLTVWANEGKQPGWVKRFEAAQHQAKSALAKARGGQP